MIRVALGLLAALLASAAHAQPYGPGQGVPGLGGNLQLGTTPGNTLQINSGVWTWTAPATTFTNTLVQALAGNQNPLTEVCNVDNGDPGGTSDIRCKVSRIQAYGANNYQEVRLNYGGVDIYDTAGTVANGYVWHGYFFNHGAANVTFPFGFFAHMVSLGDTAGPGLGGNLADARVFEAGSTVLGNGGTATTVTGFSTSDLGNSGSGVTNVYAFRAEATQGITTTFGFRSDILANTGAWGFYESGTANNAFLGNVEIGAVSIANATLSVNGYEFLSGGLGLGIVNNVPDSLNISQDGTDYITIQDASAAQAVLRKFTASGASDLDIDAVPQDNAGAATVRLFRDTNTAGAVNFQIERGNNTGTTDFQLHAGTTGASYLAANGGDVGIGTSSPTAVLHIAGTDTGTDQSLAEITGTLASSNTSAQFGESSAPLFTPSGASLAALYGIQVIPTLNAASAIAPTTFYGASVGIKEGSGASYTIATGIDLSIENPVTTSANAITAFRGISFATVTNGNGITTGTVTNRNIFDTGPTAAAASGGTVNNYTAEILLGSASGAGTNVNRALYLSGNGSTGGGGSTTNWILYSDSTASSSILGSVTIGANTAPTSPLTVAGAGTLSGALAVATASTNSLTFTGAGSGSGPIIAAVGDANLNIVLTSKGTGGIVLGTQQTIADNATCTTNTFWADASAIYVCTASGTVKRVVLLGF